MSIQSTDSKRGGNLTQFQVIVFTVLIVCVLGLGIPRLYKVYNHFYSNKILDTPHEWDEDNVLTLQDQIGDLTKSLKSNYQEIEILNDYRDLLQSGIGTLSATKIDTTTLDTGSIKSALLSIQPALILHIAYLQERSYSSDIGAGGDLSVVQNNHLQIINKIRDRSAEYASLYRTLVATYGFGVTTSYGRPSTIATMAFDDIDLTTLGASTSINKINLISALATSARRIDTMVENRSNFLTKQIIANKVTVKDLEEKYKTNNQNINRYAVIIGIPLFIAAVLIMYYLGLRNSNIMREQVVKNNLDPELYRFGLTFSLSGITVLLLILSLLILGLASVLKENGLAALFGAIAGYVLNNATGKSTPSTPPPPKPAPPIPNPAPPNL